MKNNFTTLFACSIAIILSAVYLICRSGFNDLHLQHVFEVLGLSLFFMILPSLLSQNLSQSPRWFCADAFLTILILLAVCFVGFLISYVDLLNFLKWIFSFSGYLAFGFLLFKTGISILRIPSLLTVIITFCFSIWVTCIFWGYGMFSPLYFESFSIRLPHIDTLFHISIAQMLKTYGIPSTGVQGISFFPYHFGSHFLFVQLSSFLKMDLLLFYPLAFPILFLPMFFKMFLELVMAIKANSFTNLTKKPFHSVLFWVVFLSGFIGFLPFDLLNKSGLAHYAIIMSESYSVSLSFGFALFITSLLFWREHKGTKEITSEKAIFLFVAIPLFVFAIGMLKISTVYIVVILLSYTFLRLKLYKSLSMTVSWLTIGLMTLWVLSLTYHFKSGGTELHLFHYLRNYIHVPYIVFFVLFFGWLIIFSLLVVLRFKRNREQTRSQIYKKDVFILEILLVAAIAGFLPGALLEIHGGSANYFMEPQYWICLAYVLAYVAAMDRLSARLTNLSMAKRLLVLLLVLGSFGLIAKNIRFHYNLFLHKNLSLRKNMIDRTDIEYPSRRMLSKQLFKNGISFEKNIRTLIFEPQKQIVDDQEYRFFSTLREYESIRNKKELIVFVENKHALHSTFPCMSIPFAIPALSGIATLNGIPYDYCPAVDYGYEHFTLESRNEIGRLNTSESLCEQLIRTDIKRIGILYYHNLKADSVKFLECDQHAKQANEVIIFRRGSRNPFSGIFPEILRPEFGPRSVIDKQMDIDTP